MFSQPPIAADELMAASRTPHNLQAQPDRCPINQLARVTRQPRSIARGNLPPMHQLAPSLSWILAGCTTTASSNPGIYNDMSLSTRPSCQHHSHEAPFFGRLHALAVMIAALRSVVHPVRTLSRRAWTLSRIPMCGSSETSAPRGKVVWKHPPRTPAPKYVHDGVHHLPARILDRTASRFRSGQQRL